MEEARAFAGTKIADILHNVHAVYADIENEQHAWKQHTPVPCPAGCGMCCEHFEPDVYEYEALYLAAWLLAHDGDKAEMIRTCGAGQSLNNDNGCFLYDPQNPHHCTVYGGRCLICRLFGHSGSRGKDMKIHWKPCKFAPCTGTITGTGASTGTVAVAAANKREYGEAELFALYGAVPPDMAQAASRLLALNPDDTHTRPLREALPEAIEKLRLILRFLTPPEPNSPEPDLPSPCPLSA